MAATVTAPVSTTWDDERDAAFFRIVTELFSHDFTYGASVLLASYDDDDAAGVASPAAPAAVDLLASVRR